MPDYKKLYFRLFGALADAVEAMDASDFTAARELLIRAQQEAEEEYISAE